jgi:hypothetical protein
MAETFANLEHLPPDLMDRSPPRRRPHHQRFQHRSPLLGRDEVAARALDQAADQRVLRGSLAAAAIISDRRRAPI